MMIREDRIEIENDLIYYQTFGSWPDGERPMPVFLHDALGSTAQWKDFPARLIEKTGLPAIVYDRAGYGRSSPLNEPRGVGYLHKEAGRVLPTFLEELGIEQPVLFGHSDGGTIALLYAARFPARAIICLAAHVLVEKETLEGIRRAAEQRDHLVEKLSKYHGAEKAERLFDEWQRVWLSDEFRDWNITSELKKIECPALLIQGRQDEYATAGHLQIIAAGIGDNARPVLIENCGHLPHLDAPKKTLEITAEFLRSL